MVTIGSPFRLNLTLLVEIRAINLTGLMAGRSTFPQHTFTFTGRYSDKVLARNGMPG
jgi:hypothetical protein